MLNFKRVNIVFLLIVVVFVAARRFWGFPLYGFGLLALMYASILFYGSYFIQARFYVKSVCAGPTLEKCVAISFDDGPADAFTPQILEVLRDHQVQAAFFCIGRHIAGREHILQQILDQGHLIGNHSFSHDPWFDLFSTRRMLNDMKLMDHATEHVTGLRPRFFRPPYGVTNPNLSRAIRQGDYVSVGWTVRSLDTVSHRDEKLLSRVLKGLRPGAIMLFHDHCEITLRILPRLLQELNSRGYQVQRLDKLLKLEPYA